MKKPRTSAQYLSMRRRALKVKQNRKSIQHRLRQQALQLYFKGN